MLNRSKQRTVQEYHNRTFDDPYWKKQLYITALHNRLQISTFPEFHNLTEPRIHFDKAF